MHSGESKNGVPVYEAPSMRPRPSIQSSGKGISSFLSRSRDISTTSDRSRKSLCCRTAIEKVVSSVRLPDSQRQLVLMRVVDSGGKAKRSKHMAFLMLICSPLKTVVSRSLKLKDTSSGLYSLYSPLQSSSRNILRWRSISRTPTRSCRGLNPLSPSWHQCSSA